MAWREIGRKLLLSLSVVLTLLGGGITCYGASLMSDAGRRFREIDKMEAETPAGQQLPAQAFEINRTTNRVRGDGIEAMTIGGSILVLYWATFIWVRWLIRPRAAKTASESGKSPIP